MESKAKIVMRCKYVELQITGMAGDVVVEEHQS
jgi:hypothetical protein